LAVGLNADLRTQGEPRRAASAVNPLGVVWTPDGQSLVYSAGTSGNEFLYRADLASGREPKRLEIASQGASYPALARKGNRLAFVRFMGDLDVWRLQEGGKPQPLLVSTALDASAQFSPDGRRIVFASGRGGEGTNIWMANADGTGLVELTRGPEESQGSPSWSPDGRWIAFDAQGNDGRWYIKVVESGGGLARRLTQDGFSNTVPSWSRDGKWIYFTSERSGRFEIWRIPSQGGAAEQVTRGGGYVGRESADGKMLYFTKTSGDGPLYVRPLSGGDETQVVGNVVRRAFVVFADGIYYLYKASPGSRISEIRFHEFASDQSRLISPIEGYPFLYLSVSPDRKTFLFTLFGSVGSDLMIIENFR
jgi:Tol biopolymer transport system component